MSRTIRNDKTIPTEGSIEPQLTPDNCTHEHPRYHTRFGDWCCSACHRRMGWHPSLVREGIYDDRTDEWIASQGPASGECAQWGNKVASIWRNK